MKNLTRTLFIGALLSLVLLASDFSFAQRVYFCEGVDDEGYAINESSSFTIGRDGGFLYVLTRLNSKCNTYQVIMDIFRINSSGKEEFETTLYMDTKPSWVWFWKKVTFYDPGKYVVYIYDEDENYLASGEVRINFR